MLSLNEQNSLINLLKHTLHECSELIDQFNRKELVEQSKDDNFSRRSKIVTEIDFKLEKLIESRLKNFKTTVSIGFLSEETQDDLSRFDNDYFWCIDPLDGTLCFFENKKGFSISVALVNRSGEVILSAVMDPSQNNVYTAIRDRFLYLNEKPIEMSSSSKINFIYDESLYLSIDKNNPIFAKNYHFKTGYGAVLNAIEVIKNDRSIYVKPPREIKGGGALWDFAAVALFIKENNGWISDYYLNPINFNKKKHYFNEEGIIIASNKSLAQKIIKELNL